MKPSFCIGYSPVFGEPHTQVIDDGLKALYWKDLIQWNPNFQFNFDLFAKFTYKNNEGEDFPIVESTQLQMRIDSWFEYNL